MKRAISQYKAGFDAFENEVRSDAQNKLKLPATALNNLETDLKAAKETAISSQKAVFTKLETEFKTAVDDVVSTHTKAFTDLMEGFQTAKNELMSLPQTVLDDFLKAFGAHAPKVVDDWLWEGFPSLSCCNPKVITEQLESQLDKFMDQAKAGVTEQADALIFEATLQAQTGLKTLQSKTDFGANASATLAEVAGDATEALKTVENSLARQSDKVARAGDTVKIAAANVTHGAVPKEAIAESNAYLQSNVPSMGSVPTGAVPNNEISI